MVNFLEWDGLVRLCFNRKNKTLGAIFRTKSTLRIFAADRKSRMAFATKFGASAPNNGNPQQAEAGTQPKETAPPTATAAAAATGGDNPFAAMLGLGAASTAAAGGGASAMDIGDGQAPPASEQPLDEVRGIIDKVLEETGFAEQRPSKMSLDDFMHLLHKFNEADIHFISGGFGAMDTESGDTL